MSNTKIITAINNDRNNILSVIKDEAKYYLYIVCGDNKGISTGEKISLRDPSADPSWIVWFSSVKDFKDPIISHATLWRQNSDQTGVIINVCWLNSTFIFERVVDKPKDIISIMFRAASTPALLIKNLHNIEEPVEKRVNWGTLY